MKTKRKVKLVVTLLLFVAVISSCKKSHSKAYELTGIRLSATSLSIKVGEGVEVKAVAIPAAANQPSFQWVSANTAIATVNNGLVKAVAVGETIITVSSASINTKLSVKVEPASSNSTTYNDTVFRITLQGASYPFANPAEYGIYIPTRTEKLQGVLVIQHGCGMEQFGITKPYDLQYRAFARKWNLAIIETALYGNCGGWRSPESGTGDALLKVLNDAGVASNHPELKTVPWLLWGHSGGGHWVLGMVKTYPHRIMAAVCYSPAFDPQWTYPAAAANVPLLTRHAGANDANDEGVLCQATSINAFSKLRSINAPVSIALNETQNHNFSYIRYMAIPFYEAVMKQRLPINGATTMNNLDVTKTWLGDTLTHELYQEASYTGDKKSLCVFPDEATAKNWKEYVTTGTVVDKTPPPPPTNLKITKSGADIEVSWSAEADIESGILRFEIFKDGTLIGHLPSVGAYQTFDTNGDNTLPTEVPAMKYKIMGGAASNASISIRTVNHFNLASEKTEIIYTP